MTVHMIMGLAAMDELEISARTSTEAVVMMVECLRRQQWDDAEIARTTAAGAFEAWLDKIVELNRRAAGWGST